MWLRKWAIVALLLLILLCIGIPAGAWKASKLGAAVGDIYFGWEWVIQRPSATLFHSQNLAATDTEALAISFPSAGNSFAPAIAQTTAETATATDTGFFTANWCYTALTNHGGYDLVPDVSMWHPVRSASPVGAGISWPYMNNAPLYGESTMVFNPSINMAPDTSGVSLSLAPDVMSDVTTPTTTKMSVANGASNASNKSLLDTVRLVNQSTEKGSNTTSGATNMTQTKPNRDYKNMTKPDIQNASGLERLYRNPNMVNTIPKSYKGTVDRPTIIAPMENPMDLIKPANKPKVIADSRNMTKEGTHLKTLFWDL